jgi:hypothetical protein
MGQYINSTVGSEAYAFLIADIPEPSNFQLPLDVCAWIVTELYERDVMGEVDLQLIPHGGWHGILERARAAAAAAGVRFFSDSPIACISSVANASAASTPPVNVAAADAVTSRTNGSYQFVATGPGDSAGRVFLAEHVIFASGTLDVQKLGGDVGRRLAAAPEIASIRPIEVVVYDAFYLQRFWDDYMIHRYYNMPMHMDANCLVHSEFPGHVYYRVTNASRPVYSAHVECNAFWGQLFNASGMPGVRSYVQTSLQKMFPLQHVPAPYLDAFVLHPVGWHMVAYGASQRIVTVDSIFDWAAAPLGEDGNLCLVGEAYYGIAPGWTAGAFRTAHNCIKQQFADILSGPALAAAEYISSGCNGKKRFPNELVLSRNASMPGLNPATAKVLEE